jgi:hypothetical protein
LVSYSISEIDNRLINNLPLIGSFKIIQGKSQLLVRTRDNIITNNVVFKLSLDNEQASISVLIKAKIKAPPSPGIRTDVTGCIEKIVVLSPGYGYTTGDRITDGKNLYTPIVSPNSGAIVNILSLNNPICGFDKPPNLIINTNTGIGAEVIPLMKYYPSYETLKPQKISIVGIKTVIDCV